MALLSEQLNDISSFGFGEVSFEDLSEDHLHHPDHTSPPNVTLIIGFSVAHPDCVNESLLKLLFRVISIRLP